ncbi:hypothetical protein [Pseudonocardia sp. H11422]|nr:hypothetical protein [Pseudonocardia sp. H11422]
MTDMAAFNAQIIDESRADGQVGGPFEDSSMVLLLHTGSRSARSG